MSYIDKNSFMFGTVDMYDRFGIQLTNEIEDLLLPGLRERKVVIPGRSGSYDYGARYYNERGLRLTCTTPRRFEREEIREISYILSKKNEIRIWNEPDKYYLGRIYDQTALSQLKKYVQEFDLTFICEPFAIGEHKQENFGNFLDMRNNSHTYIGTAPTPTHIEITNNGLTAATGIQITMIRKIVY